MEERRPPEERAPGRRERTDAWIMGLVLAASGLVMLAPLLGRWGAAEIANATMLVAAGCGLAAYAAAAVHMVRAARRARPPHEEEGRR